MTRLWHRFRLWRIKRRAMRDPRFWAQVRACDEAIDRAFAEDRTHILGR